MNYLIPKDETGSLVHYVTMNKGEQMTWVAPEPFLGVLQVASFYKTRSDRSVVWKDVFTGATYHMTFKNFQALFDKPVWQGHFIVDGKWQPYKAGDYYNIKFVEE